MSKIKEFDAATYDYLTNVEEQWSVHMFNMTVCCDHNTTNFVESFNVITKANRDMPVLTLLEGKFVSLFCSFKCKKIVVAYCDFFFCFLNN